MSKSIHTEEQLKKCRLIKIWFNSGLVKNYKGLETTFYNAMSFGFSKDDMCLLIEEDGYVGNNYYHIPLSEFYRLNMIVKVGDEMIRNEDGKKYEINKTDKFNIHTTCGCLIFIEDFCNYTHVPQQLTTITTTTPMTTQDIINAIQALSTALNVISTCVTVDNEEAMKELIAKISELTKKLQ